MQKGFTLLEILIAMAIFTLIGLASTGLLTTVIDSNDLSSERFQKLQQLQRAMVILERDIQQAVPRAARIEGEQQNVVMAGGESDMGGHPRFRAQWLAQPTVHAAPQYVAVGSLSLTRRQIRTAIQ